MKILMINVVCGIRSTGRICTDLADELTKQGNEVKIAYGRGEVPEKYKKYAVKIGNSVDQKMHAIKTRLFDEHGFGSKKVTKDFLLWAESYKPDMLWLHNIHGYYINIEMLFDWIKVHPTLSVKWTLHDCWAFTGHCSYFTKVQCNQWESRCQKCIQKRSYPGSMLRDNCSKNFERKKVAFTGVKKMMLITPSMWLAELVKKSFLSEYPVEVCYNTIDTSVFKPTLSDFKSKFDLEGKRIILGVASIWDDRKGFDDFLELSEMLDKSYVIVLVGLNDKQIKRLPSNIVGIKRTNSPGELAAIYTAADVFVNPTYEDNYPTVNLEAKACGTPVITYRTGGSVESVEVENIVDVGDISALYKRIICVTNKKEEEK